MIITESGVHFGDFPDEDCFYIEKSNFYKNLGEGIKTTEFVLMKNGKLLFVEVKTSAPKIEDLSQKCKQCSQIIKKQSCINCWQTESPWNKYVDELETKFQHTLTMYALSHMQRHKLEESEQQVVIHQCQQFDWESKKKNIILLLIITIQIDWALNSENINQIQEQLRKQLRPLLKLWNAELLVFNTIMATEKGLIYQ